eukprot:7380390-Prymnesium_polylepis.1
MGGAGELGLRSAAMLVRRGATGVTVALCSGRAGQTSLPAAVQLVACDAAGPSEMLALLSMQPLTGVLHATGMLCDTMLYSMTSSDVRSAFSSKAASAANLHASISTMPLRAVGLLSSVTAAFGGIGQAPCAAASAYLDALAASRRH